LSEGTRVLRKFISIVLLVCSLPLFMQIVGQFGTKHTEVYGSAYKMRQYVGFPFLVAFLVGPLFIELVLRRPRLEENG
jgi:hypothetical protein